MMKDHRQDQLQFWHVSKTLSRINSDKVQQGLDNYSDKVQRHNKNSVQLVPKFSFHQQKEILLLIIRSVNVYSFPCFMFSSYTVKTILQFVTAVPGSRIAMLRSCFMGGHKPVLPQETIGNEHWKSPDN